MAKYIDREALVELIDERNRNTCNGALSCLQLKRMALAIPAADVAPVRHGVWKLKMVGPYRDLKQYSCTECGFALPLNPSKLPKYCEDCGAKMEQIESNLI